MDKIKSYQDLLVWQKTMDLITRIYTLAQTWPQSELYGLVSQIRRSSTSIAANIAEGYGRRTTREYARFLSIASGSVAETETLMLLAMRLSYVPAEDAHSCLNAIAEVGKMLSALRSRVLAAPRREAVGGRR